MNKKRLVVSAVIVLIVMMVHLSSADVPQLINFQGNLHDNAGNPLSGQYGITFRIYDGESGGTPLWSETNTVNCENGLYTVILGLTTPFNLDFNGQYWLGVQVTGDTELSPRYRLVSVPTAFRAQVAASADLVSWTNLTGVPAGFADGTDDVGAAGGVSQIHAGRGIEVTNPTGPTSTVAADIGSGAEQVAAGDHTHHSLDAGDGDPTDVVYVDDDGDVGIGRNNPEAKLHVGGVSRFDLGSGSVSMSTPGGWPGVIAYSPNGNRRDMIFYDDRFALLMGNSSSPPTSTNGMIIRENGNVGIGTMNPSTTLEVAGAIVSSGTDALPSIRLKNTSADEWRITSYSDNKLLFWNGADRMAIDQNGNVGIGTATPAQRLHVAGISEFDVGGGSISVSTPGGWPGIIALSPGGNRRDIQFYDDRLSITTSASSSPPTPTSGIIIRNSGHVGIGTLSPTEKLDVAGHIKCQVLNITGGSDLSEQFNIRGSEEDVSPSPGMVVSIDPDRPGNLVVSHRAYDRTVAGIISGAGGVLPGMLMGQKGSEADGASSVALTGRVYCWADASNGRIGPGDLLTTSDIPGHAMKVTDYLKAQGAILGKSMSSLDSDRGLILVLVTLQ